MAVAGVVYAFAHGLQQQALYEKEARDAHAIYSRNSAAKIHSACLAVPLAEREECLRKAPYEKAESDYNNRREYADLVAQRTSALWTKIMGVAAVIGMFLSAVGVFLVYTTFAETKNANKIFIDSNRPIIHNRIKFHDHGGGFYGISIQAANLGNSVAIIHRTSSGIYPEKPKMESLTPAEEKTWPVSPNEFITFGVASEFKAEDFGFFAAGYVEYSSRQSGRHVSYYCFVIEPSISHTMVMAITNRVGRDVRGRDWPLDT